MEIVDNEIADPCNFYYDCQFRIFEFIRLGSGDNKTFLSIREQLLRAWSVIEMDVEANGMMFFKYVAFYSQWIMKCRVCQILAVLHFFFKFLLTHCMSICYVAIMQAMFVR